jgi:hypothetical protein
MKMEIEVALETFQAAKPDNLWCFPTQQQYIQVPSTEFSLRHKVNVERRSKIR